MKFKHYKGGEYELMMRAKHETTKEEHTVYRNIETGEVWVRPSSEFNGAVEVNGVPTRRFLPAE
jgi:hypothetical protein